MAKQIHIEVSDAVYKVLLASGKSPAAKMCLLAKQFAINSIHKEDKQNAESREINQ